MTAQLDLTDVDRELVTQFRELAILNPVVRGDLKELFSSDAILVCCSEHLMEDYDVFGALLPIANMGGGMRLSEQFDPGLDLDPVAVAHCLCQQLWLVMKEKTETQVVLCVHAPCLTSEVNERSLIVQIFHMVCGLERFEPSHFLCLVRVCETRTQTVTFYQLDIGKWNRWYFEYERSRVADWEEFLANPDDVENGK